MGDISGSSPCLKALVVVAVVVPLASLLNAQVNQTLLDTVIKCDSVVTGVIAEIRSDVGTVTVTENVFGAPVTGEISISPLSVASCVGRSISVGQQEEVLLLLSSTSAAKTYRVVFDGAGLIKIQPDGRSSLIEAITKLGSLSRIHDADELNRAMLALVNSPNPTIQREALRHVVIRIARAPNRIDYASDLIDLLSSHDKSIRMAALRALGRIKAAKGIPKLVETTRDSDVDIAAAASSALVLYETPETASALIALTHNSNPTLRVRGAIDLGNSACRQPEAKAALVALLNDPDVMVREHAPARLIGWLRDSKADDVIPKLIQMLNDPTLAVQTSAALTLGESRKASIVQPLLSVLARPTLDKTLELRTLQSLYMTCEESGDAALDMINKSLHLIVSSLDRCDDWVKAIPIVLILEKSHDPRAVDALTKAAASHPNEATRAEARRILLRKRAVDKRGGGGMRTFVYNRDSVSVATALLFVCPITPQPVSSTALVWR
jgi:HEAT repeat protein